ncbi:MAG: hypothetical protein JWQ79_4009 [Mucilaginibacter sp.]|nr:hypothetical protein [Mucilaginibacter sp.]
MLLKIGGRQKNNRVKNCFENMDDAGFFQTSDPAVFSTLLF